MIEVLTEQGLNLSVKAGQLVVSPKTKLTESLRAFIRQNKESLVLELQTQNLKSLLLSNPFLQEQFEFEIEERTAIMILDANLSESEAINLARIKTTEIWLSLF